MEKIVNVVKALDVKLNEKGQLGQKDRNGLKANLVAALMEVFAANDEVEVNRVADGIALTIYNEKMDEAITVVVDPVVKAIGFDAAAEADAFADEKAEKAARAAARKEAAEKKKARDAAERAAKKAA